MTEERKPFDPQAMDFAATEAEQELSDAHVEEELEKGIAWVIDWYGKWYMKAGHKRLGRLLARYFKDKAKEKRR